MTIGQDELIQRISATLASRPYKSTYSDFSVTPSTTASAAYALILGAGFSHGVVPLVNELMQETIGNYHYRDQDQSSVPRPVDILRKDSARFWAEFNEAAAQHALPMVPLNDNGLPKHSGAAYQQLFTGDVANALLARGPGRPKKATFVEQLTKQRRDRLAPPKQHEEKARVGQRYVDGFLRYVLNPGGEHGYGSTGRNELNPAHVYLAALLEAQQLGQGWTTGAFCRTIFTTNFDTLLQNALQMVNLLYRLTDRPENGLDPSDFHVEEGPIHLVYVHGSILRHNPASTIDELGGLESQNVKVLQGCLDQRDVIVIGYGGWNDGLMAALRPCVSPERHVYWCDVGPEPAPHVATFLRKQDGRAVYVQLGKTGAGGFMHDLYEALIPADARRDPTQRYQDWSDLVWNRKNRALK